MHHAILLQQFRRTLADLPFRIFSTMWAGSRYRPSVVLSKWRWSVIPQTMRTLRGRVVSGRGDFGFWIERLYPFYEHKTGLRLYPGTLNLELTSPSSLPPQVIRLEADEYGGRVSVSLVPCRIFGRQAFLLRTDELDFGHQAARQSAQIRHSRKGLGSFSICFL
jgi:hypothetical protein